MPFEIPESWAWVTLSEVCEVARGGSPRPIKDYLTTNEDGVNWIKIGDTDKDGKYINSTKEKIIPEGVHRSRFVHKGDFLLTNSMSFGRPYILNIDGCIHDGWLVISPFANTYVTEFLYFLLSSSFAYDQFADAASGGVVSNLNSDKVANSYFPLPPEREQRRIINELNNWFKVVGELDKNIQGVKSFVSRIKSKILDLAISGKLVPQDSNDEPAIELLRRINPGFKPCDNSHYENLPENWCLAKVKDVFVINPRNKAEDNTIAGFIPMTLIDDGYSNTFSYEKRKWGAIKTGFTHFADGDVAVAKISPCLENRKSIVLRDLPNGIGAGTTELHVFRSSVVSPEYALYFFKSEYFISRCVGTFNGVVGQQRVGKNIIEEIQIPIPPINEQKKIVSTIETIFTQLNTITAEL